MTTFTLKPTLNARERILGIGGYGAGKSHGALCVAKRIPTATFHVIDTDDAYERLMEDEQFADLDNIAPYAIDNDFDALLKTVEAIAEVASPDDWVDIDMVGPAWEWAAEEAEYDEPVEAKNGELMTVNWQQAATRHGQLIKKLHRLPCHLYCTSNVKDLPDSTGRKSGTKDKEMRTMWGQLGFRPEGHKTLARIFHTVLLFVKTGGSRYYLTTIKDRGRYELSADPLDDLATDYLIDVAGWKMGKP